MKGIGKRVTIGFMSIVGLLVASGIISLFELSNLSNDTESILSASRRKMELAKDMINAAHEHSEAVLHIVLFGDNSQKDACRRTMSDLDGRIATARNEAKDASRLDSLSMAVTQLREVADSYIFAQSQSAEVDSLMIDRGREWYDVEYKAASERLIGEIQNYMTHIHSSLKPRAEQLNKNAYRAVAPVFISLVVIIAIVMMFYYFVRVYCVVPIKRINRALSDYLSYRLPFHVKAELIDELKEVVDHIEVLIGLSKQKKE